MRVTHINRRLRAWFRAMTNSRHARKTLHLTFTSDETDVFLCRDIH
jgi:hypothetical protein